MTKTSKGKKAAPSARLAAQRPAKHATAGADVQIDSVQIGGDADVVRCGSMLLRTADKVRFKWVVKHKGEVPVVAGDTLASHWLVQLEAAYEPLSIHDGQATVQGNLDNRAFGLGVPKAELSLVLASKAIADAFHVGRAYHSDFSAVTPVLHGLY